jgi:hypothetical protein
VKLGSGVFNEFHYTIYNSNGQKMLSGKLRNTERTINLSQLSEGLYFISISDETSSVNVNRKLIKLNNL